MCLCLCALECVCVCVCVGEAIKQKGMKLSERRTIKKGLSSSSQLALHPFI